MKKYEIDSFRDDIILVISCTEESYRNTFEQLFADGYHWIVTGGQGMPDKLHPYVILKENLMLDAAGDNWYKETYLNMVERPPEITDVAWFRKRKLKKLNGSSNNIL